MSSDTKIEFEDNKIIIYRKQIQNELVGKLSEDDINLSKDIIKKNIDKRKLFLEILTSSRCEDCQELNNDYSTKCSNRPGPYGTMMSDIVFVNKIPTVLECASMLSHSDTAGHFLMLIIKKLGLNPDNLYFTDFIKCPSRTLSEDSCWHCVVNYFLREIDYIKPKAIVFQGLTAMNMLYNDKILLNKPEKIEYGIIYDSYFITEDRPVKILGIYDLDMVLQKEGNELQQCKNVIWNNLLSIVKSIQS